MAVARPAPDLRIRLEVPVKDVRRPERFAAPSRDGIALMLTYAQSLWVPASRRTRDWAFGFHATVSAGVACWDVDTQPDTAAGASSAPPLRRAACPADTSGADDG